MLVAPRKGFVFLANTKAASTSIEDAFGQYAQMKLQGLEFKHTTYAQFQRFLQPFLAAKGYPRSSYEVVCVFREPIDWLSSWWRYRSRPELADPSRPKHHNYAGHLSFEQFACAYLKGDEQFARVGRQYRFVQARSGEAKVDRIFRYDRLDLLIDYLCEKVGTDVAVGFENVSPKLSFSLSEERERELRALFFPEYRIYQQAIGSREPQPGN